MSRAKDSQTKEIRNIEERDIPRTTWYGSESGPMLDTGRKVCTIRRVRQNKKKEK